MCDLWKEGFLGEEQRAKPWVKGVLTNPTFSPEHGTWQEVPGCTWYIQRSTTLTSFYLPSPPHTHLLPECLTSPRLKALAFTCHRWAVSWGTRQKLERSPAHSCKPLGLDLHLPRGCHLPNYRGWKQWSAPQISCLPMIFQPWHPGDTLMPLT